VEGSNSGWALSTDRRKACQPPPRGNSGSSRSPGSGPSVSRRRVSTMAKDTKLRRVWYLTSIVAVLAYAWGLDVYEAAAPVATQYDKGFRVLISLIPPAAIFALVTIARRRKDRGT